MAADACAAPLGLALEELERVRDSLDRCKARVAELEREGVLLRRELAVARDERAAAALSATDELRGARKKLTEWPVCVCVRVAFSTWHSPSSSPKTEKTL